MSGGGAVSVFLLGLPDGGRAAFTAAGLARAGLRRPFGGDARFALTGRVFPGAMCRCQLPQWHIAARAFCLVSRAASAPPPDLTVYNPGGGARLLLFGL